jgi:RNA polymerase sigma factor (sigma-70 family)
MVTPASMGIVLHKAALLDAVMANSKPSLSSDDSQARRLTAAIARGDEMAFEEFYDLYNARLFRLVVVLSRGDETITDEVVQSAMLTAAAKLRPLETEQHLWNWLAQVARQHLIKVWRHRKREPALVGLEEFPDIASNIEPDRALEESLNAALLALEQSDRQLIEWFYFDDAGHQEISRRLNITSKAVSSRLERARAKLRLLLNRRLSHEP